ncbi:hypothetical protein GQ55_7G131600 [Panicum hallii var. hallii]|uniref:Uncharacterized protein n=1 Tax=Panicum hallii var. hallii TaxID=1504633 RepID=A0A2T7CUM4_9POAL|nr:hypothetical protein GQ55_7G131600 [Panicum hallii var. hallii]
MKIFAIHRIFVIFMVAVNESETLKGSTSSSKSRTRRKKAFYQKDNGSGRPPPLAPTAGPSSLSSKKGGLLRSNDMALSKIRDGVRKKEMKWCYL